MLGASGSEQFVALDAGTVYAGLQKAVEKNVYFIRFAGDAKIHQRLFHFSPTPRPCFWSHYQLPW
jgi:hypothetical protein